MSGFETSKEDNHPTFEETYPRYEFAPLVLLAMALGAWLAGLTRSELKRPASSGPGSTAPAR